MEVTWTFGNNIYEIVSVLNRPFKYQIKGVLRNERLWKYGRPEGSFGVEQVWLSYFGIDL